MALDILRRDSEVLKCYNDRWDAIWYAELGSSAAILNAGFNIASLLHRRAAQRPGGSGRAHGPPQGDGQQAYVQEDEERLLLV